MLSSPVSPLGHELTLFVPQAGGHQNGGGHERGERNTVHGELPTMAEIDALSLSQMAFPFPRRSTRSLVGLPVQSHRWVPSIRRLGVYD
jgi:hypothetical protein